ncbi:MAG: hypothetical protein FWD91_06340, partial [Treponema sp.]|nr:hypothetical protein [Treponema sp.]
MGFFTVGNLVTLGIALLLLVLFRQMDKNNRHMKRLRDYADTLKKDLTVYMEEHEQAIKDYGIALDVEREAAKELMRRLRKMNEEELAEKAAAMAQLDSQVKLYEGSLAELDRMTSRVQENMNRIRDESSFVEATGKRLKEVQEQLLETGKEVRDMKAGFERENAEALEKAVNMMMADVQSAVSDLSAQAETAQRQVEDHRLAIDKIEERRAEEIARHEEHITELLKMVVDHAGQKADKLEEAALQSLKEQAEERIRRLKAAEEERLKEYQENAKARVLEAKDLISTFRQEWQIERAAWEGRDKELREDRAKGIEEFSSTLQAAEQHLADVKAAFDQQMRDFSQRTSETLAANEALTLKTAEQMKQKALEATGAELEEYRRTQDAEFQRLLSLADDAKKLDGELRQSMQEATGKMREEFALYREEAARAQKAEFDKFSAAASAFKSGMAEIEKELTALKDAAAYNTSGNLKIFEENFQADLAKRNSEIHGRFIAWQNELESRLAAMSVEAEKQRQDMEQSLSGEMRKQFTAQDERLVADLSHLKEETAAFGESIRGQMSAADESLASLKEQLAASFEEAKQGSESFLKAEISKQSLAAAETVKQYQRELDGKFHEMSEYIETRNGEISALVNTSRADLAQAREELAGKIRELDNSIEDARKRVRDVAADNDSRIASVRSSVEDTERHIREAIDQAKLIDKADALRLDLGRRIEDLKADIDRLDQRRAEAFQLENDFVKIKRLEDDVNAK